MRSGFSVALARIFCTFHSGEVVLTAMSAHPMELQ